MTDNQTVHLDGVEYEIVRPEIVTYPAKETPEAKAMRIRKGLPPPTLSFTVANVVKKPVRKYFNGK